MINAIYHFLESLGYQHPLHPVLVHLPIGLNIGALLLSLAARILHKPELQRSAYHALVIVCFFAFLALGMGYLDWQHYFNGTWLWPIRVKLLIALPYTALMTLGVFIGYRYGPQAKALLPIYAIGFFSVMSLGYLGGELTFTGRTPAATEPLAEGQSLFEANCSSCHPSGGNRFTPSKPLLSAWQLASLETFKTHVRNPKLAGGDQSIMPAFTSDKLSDTDLAKLYLYIQRYLSKADCVPSENPVNH